MSLIRNPVATCINVVIGLHVVHISVDLYWARHLMFNTVTHTSTTPYHKNYICLFVCSAVYCTFY